MFSDTSYIFFLQVSGTIRNCCFEAENQLQNLLLVSEFLWPALLLPVAGNKVNFLQKPAFSFDYFFLFALPVIFLLSITSDIRTLVISSSNLLI